MTVLAHLEPLEESPTDRRGAARLLLRLGSMLGSCGSSVVIHNLSPTGLLLETSADLAAGDIIVVELPEIGGTQATVLWRDGHSFGCQFDNRIPKAAVSAALLRSDGAMAAPPADHENDTSRPTPANKSHSIRGGIVAALLFGGVAYFVFTAGIVTVLVAAALLSLLLGLLVAWGLWVLDNTPTYMM